ncbi:hypothetical protein Aeqsu_0084 [Aequorivita sublithincola DSM 14238]|uniref:Uncharacterized protein n=1 Tax=Aequorivita sublithincola (strain DSM 14238 / LMG 21431 / ACAM 643 / 9-3) TaxID=746697 RepID=I3YRJ8_AEQSU|nr:hypothetical protein [Aequorivita sublithincola]AFL79616.1 hypothetical protein Aeqsu_0084 [Aequorivita sublithincola DSM 14238]
MNPTENHTVHNDVKKWFQSKGFEKVQFNNDKEFFSTDWLAESVSFKLTKVKGFDTFIKSAFGGAILVFEYKIEDNKINYNCYAPIWLFGIWAIKLNFRKKVSYLFQYLKEGYKIKEEFDHFINVELPNNYANY